MTTFDNREAAFENKFAHDQDMAFRVTARRNKLLGQWAAARMALTEAETDAYAKSVVQADFEEAGDEDVFRKIRTDFDSASVSQSDHQIRRTMDELLVKAIDDVKNVR